MQSMMQIDPVMFHGALDRLPPVRCNRAAGSRAAIVFRRHLGEDDIPQPEPRVTKTGEMAALQQFRVDHRTGTNDLSAVRSNPGDLASLLQCLARDLFDNAAYHLAGSVSRRPTFPGAGQVTGDAHQRGCGAGGGDHSVHTGRLDPILNARDLARHKSGEPLHFALARWIVLEEFAGQTHRPEWQAHSFPNLALPRKRELAAAAAQVKQQNVMGTDAARRD